jgi:hypothetical protein
MRELKEGAAAQVRATDKNTVSIAWLKGVLSVLVALNVATFVLVLTIVLER